jgi:kynurenine formamidase
MNAGVGTHIDAPVHCIAGAKAISELDLSSLCAPCFVVDISVNVEKNSLYKLSLEDIMTFESKYGKIQSGGFVIVLTGWDKFWGISGSFRNEMKFPTLSPEAVKYLIEERIISGIGIDTLSVDLPGDRYLCHELLLGSGKYIVECVANAKALPPTGSYTMALPIKVKDATEAPVRLVALLAVLK